MKQVVITRTGEPEVLQVQEVPDLVAGPGQVRIRVEASGVNFADVMARLGVYPDSPPLPCVVGYEVAGSVDSVGEGVDSAWVGKDVIALCRFGAYADTVVVPQNQVFERPKNMSANEGAALIVNYLTAYQLLVIMGGLKKGDTILIHAAAGGVGIAATQLAKNIGAKVIGTASKSKHEYLLANGVDHCIDYTTEDFQKRVMEITNGQGVELAIDAVGGWSYTASFNCLAPTGRLGCFGFSSLAAGKSWSLWATVKGLWGLPLLKFIPTSLMDANKGVFGVNVGHLWDQVDRVSSWVHDLLDLYEQGKIRPKIDSTFPLEEAAAAHHRLHDRKNIGKVLLVVKQPAQ